MPDFETTPSTEETPLPPASGAALVRVQLPDKDLSYDAIKGAIYAQARYLHERGQPIGTLLISRDIYEILNRRLVFKTAAHKEMPHFITPYGNLRVAEMDADLDEPLSFIMKG